MFLLSSPSLSLRPCHQFSHCTPHSFFTRPTCTSVYQDMGTWEREARVLSCEGRRGGRGSITPSFGKLVCLRPFELARANYSLRL